MTSTAVNGQISFISPTDFRIYLCSDNHKSELPRIRKKWNKIKDPKSANLNGFIIFSILLANCEIKKFYNNLPDKSRLWSDAKKQEPQILMFFSNMSVRLRESVEYETDLKQFVQGFVNFVKNYKSDDKSAETIYVVLHKYLSDRSRQKNKSKKTVRRKTTNSQKKNDLAVKQLESLSSTQSQEEYSLDESDV
ncbi:hypothetical protein [Neodiprion abietis nucleopolyhedrovirus]|uniref:Uncharacterized protein n=1 Tax=Neodiprion abietis nucleopolyhedrovirus TaxID=204507 RepID=Q0ZP63_9CBAC|nr:hypothetical protein [Neodiprion abietis nucleopolyhedrovirus]ABC74891.1 unknown [Neodiprion abietis nucleopolyhedrovirus]